MNDADARMRRRGTTLLVTYILLGEILGMSIGGWEAVRPARSHFVDDSVYAARPDDDAADDADERDPMVVLPLLGLVGGAIVGAAAGQIHLAARRWHAQRTHG